MSGWQAIVVPCLVAAGFVACADGDAPTRATEVGGTTGATASGSGGAPPEEAIVVGTGNPPAPDCEPAPPACEAGTTKPCYDGPVETEGEGSCLAGVRRCNADGTAFLPCHGQVLPRPDDCAEPTDWICDGAEPLCNVVERLDTHTGDYFERPQVAVHPGGGVVRAHASGYLQELSVSRRMGELTMWTRSFGLADTNGSTNIALAVDAAGVSTLAATREGGFIVGEDLTQRALVARLDVDGNLAWMRSLGDGVSVYGVIAVDAGDVVVVGSFTGELDLGDSALTSRGLAAFAARLDAAGNARWSAQLGGGARAAVFFAATIDDQGHVFAGGSRDSEEATCGFSAALVATFDPHGRLLWEVETEGEGATSMVTALVPHPKGGVVAAGRLDTDLGRAVDLGSGERVDGRAFLARYDEHGSYVWSHAVREEAPFGDAIALLPNGRIAWATSDYCSVHLRTYLSGGGFLWKRVFDCDVTLPPGQVPEAGVTDLATHADGRLELAGLWGGEIDFGSGSQLGGYHSASYATFAP